MSRSFDVRAALHALVAAAAPSAALSGFIEDVSKPEKIGAEGAIIAGAGDPGDPEYDLSPVAYTYTHHIPVEVLFPALIGASAQPDSIFDPILSAIGEAVLANRQLGGLVNWLDVSAPTIISDDLSGAVPLRIATFDFVAEYTVSNPLGA